MQENASEYVRLMRQIELENEAAQRGLLGLASGIAPQAFIAAREAHQSASLSQWVCDTPPEWAEAGLKQASVGYPAPIGLLQGGNTMNPGMAEASAPRTRRKKEPHLRRYHLESIKRKMYTL